MRVNKTQGLISDSWEKEINIWVKFGPHIVGEWVCLHTHLRWS